MTGQQTTDDTTDESYLEQQGANTRDPPTSINVSAGSVPGPDYLGQESVDVAGHWADRPGVQWRGVDGDTPHPETREMDTGRELPVLLSSSMRADPCEGVQGTYTQIIDGECARCGYDRLRESVQTLAGERQRTCNACGARQDHRAEHGYTMPKTDGERADEMRDSGVELGQAGHFDVYDMEPDTGMGPYLYLIDGDTLTLMRKSTPFELYRSLTRADGGTGVGQIADDLNDDLDGVERILLAHALTPEGVSFDVDEGDQGQSEDTN